MIPYQGDLFGFGILTRVHGSAVYKAVLPSCISTLFYLLMYYLFPDGEELDTVEDRALTHAYAIGVLVAAFTFLLTFRANFGYNRYWEGAGAVHQMQGKWLDLGMDLAAFHYQSANYKSNMPPAYGAHPDITSVVRSREREQFSNLDEDILGGCTGETCESNGFFGKLFKKKRKPADKKARNSKHKSIHDRPPVPARSKLAVAPSFRKTPGKQMEMQSLLTSQSRLDGGIEEAPSLFLQEAVHLISLMSAVALSTLRVDIEGAESPLIPYVPGAPWPPVDPDETPKEIIDEFTQKKSSKMEKNMRFLLGTDRTARNRFLYNAARPMRVLGGVSDAEIKLLSAARGPLAKTALCTMWMQEFITREYMAGSTGNVAPPIVSRLYQLCTDGMVGYNQARKVAYIPFPFVHAQIAALFIVVLLPVVPLLMLTFVDPAWLGALLTFFSILCFCGLHEVARELENPFKNEPNDLPLVTIQAQFNEALLVMYAGYHPDAWWNLPTENETEGFTTIPENGNGAV